MGRYCYPHLTEELAAVVSTHGYFEIQRAETYNSYASHISAGHVVKRLDGSVCPTPVVVARGPVSDLGLTYNPEYDDLIDEDDDTDVIRAALLRYIEAL